MILDQHLKFNFIILIFSTDNFYKNLAREHFEKIFWEEQSLASCPEIHSWILAKVFGLGCFGVHEGSVILVAGFESESELSELWNIAQIEH